MPEYLAPGVFIEEVSYRAKSIEGVSTTTTGFIGPTRYGPIDVEPELVTGLGEFERIYGDRQQLDFLDSGVRHNYVWHAVRAFFENGGKRVYVKRVFGRPLGEGEEYGCARITIGGPKKLEIRSRFPGRGGRRRVRISLDLGANVLAPPPPSAISSPPNSPPEQPPPVLRTLKSYDMVWVSQADDLSSPPGERTGRLYLATAQQAATGIKWTFTDPSGAHPAEFQLNPGHPDLSDEVRKVTATVSVFPPIDDDPDGLPLVWGGLALDPRHASFGVYDSLSYQFHRKPENLGWRRSVPLIISPPAGSTVESGLDVWAVLRAHGGLAFEAAVTSSAGTPKDRSFDVILGNGEDGDRPGLSEYEGVDADPDDKTGLKGFEDLEEISIVAAPGATYGLDSDPTYRPEAVAIMGALIAHAERMRYRIAVLDSGDGAGSDPGAEPAGRLRLQACGALLPLGAGVRPGHPAGDLTAPERIRRRHLRPQRHQPGGLQGAGQRGGHAGPRLRTHAEQGPAGGAQPEGNQLLPLLRGPRQPALGRAHDQLRPGVEVRQPAPLLRLPGALDRRRHPVGRIRAQRPALWANVRRTVSDFLFNEFMMGAYSATSPRSRTSSAATARP